MARPSKIKSPKHAKFAVFEDAVSSRIPYADSSRQPSSNSKNDADFDSELAVSDYEQDDKQLEHISENLTALTTLGEQADTEVDNDNDYDDQGEDRRESTLTRGTSISSLPESSVFDTDYDESSMLAMHKPYTPPSMRPTFRRPDSVRKMQLMASPSPYERSSPRRSALRAKARAGTPRSAKQSPRPKAMQYPGKDEQSGDGALPLVLLHVTLLPVELRWSAESMLEVLPPNVIENLQLLRSKVSETILHRGILIPHPREEYELLEDRLLEALELRKERVTKCGHFRVRDSTSSSSSAEGSVQSADSGVAFSLDGEDGKQCMTCNSPIKGPTTAVDRNGGKWSIKVFAANGLMRAPAWTAAWSEMERVDVEILPWINEILRKQLDTLVEREEEDERRRQEDDSTRIKQVVEEQVRIAHDDRKRKDVEERSMSIQYNSTLLNARPQLEERPTARHSDLPRVYRTADIPLSMLLKNYVFLLAQDKRNIAMFALAMLVFWMSLRAAVSNPPTLDLRPITSCEHTLPQTTFFDFNNDGSVITTNIEVLDEVVNTSSTVVEAAENSVRSFATEDVLNPDSENLIHQELPKTIVSPTSYIAPVAKSRSFRVSELTRPSSFKETRHYLCSNYNLASEIFALPTSPFELSDESDAI